MSFTRKIVYLFVVATLYLVGFYMAYYLIKYESDKPPIRYATIPEFTKNFFKKLSGFGEGIIITFNPSPDPTTWGGNGSDFGEDPTSGFLKIEDENFIIYYRTGEKDRAVFCLSVARSSISSLTDLFGKYYYPKDLNGRKLPVYLANDKELFAATYKKFAGRFPSSGVMGGTFMQLSKFGWRTEAIAINVQPSSINPGDYNRQTLQHEMAHFVYFTSIDVTKEVEPFLWVSEGISEYFADAKVRFEEARSEKSKVAQISLQGEMQDSYDSYWVGYTFFKCFEKEFSGTKVKQMIHETYSKPVPDAITSSTGMTVPSMEAHWRQFVNELNQ